jgi:hypothetical protein
MPAWLPMTVDVHMQRCPQQHFDMEPRCITVQLGRQLKPHMDKDGEIMNDWNREGGRTTASLAGLGFLGT